MAGTVIFTFGTHQRFTQPVSTLRSRIPERYRRLPGGGDTATLLVELLTADRPTTGYLGQYSVGCLYRDGRTRAHLSDDVLGRPRAASPETDALLALSDRTAKRTISQGYNKWVVVSSGGDYWCAMMPLDDWPAVTLAYLHHELTADRTVIDWYLDQDPGFYPTTRRRTGPGSGKRRPAEPVDWSSIPLTGSSVGCSPCG